jgi:hypothetical protein
MSEDEWGLHATVHAPVEDVQVGTAEADVGDTDAHFAWTRRPSLDIADLQSVLPDIRDSAH